MRLAEIQPGDVVEVDKKGRKIFGLVLEVDRAGTLTFEPLCRGVSWRTARSREVVRHWRKAKRFRGASDPDVNPGQEELGFGDA